MRRSDARGVTFYSPRAIKGPRRAWLLLFLLGFFFFLFNHNFNYSQRTSVSKAHREEDAEDPILVFLKQILTSASHVPDTALFHLL